VHNLVAGEVWQRRYEQINAFEAMLADEGTTILKFFLHISKEEQKKRLQDRLTDREKQWKFSQGDLAERQHWDRYMEAYEVMLSKTSTVQAPWYIVPANRKWYRNLVVSQVILAALERLEMRYPEPESGLDAVVIE
ncbi:MAG: polyphosphate kinase 2 family protein, partial [Caldilinea sp.]